jgi:hypothetical protein
MTASLVVEEPLGLVRVPQVEGVDRQVATREGLEATDDGGLAVGEGVDDDDIMAGGGELDDGVGADVAGTAGDEDAHGVHRIHARPLRWVEVFPVRCHRRITSTRGAVVRVSGRRGTR